MEQIFDFIFHIDKHLIDITATYQQSTYLIIALIIFCETGLVITPFLPGDSLIFSAAAIAAMPGSALNIFILFIIIFAAAVVGDNTNYGLGRLTGNDIYQKNYKILNREKLLKAKTFYEKHGGLTLILGRYMPVIRTFSPFVAGVAHMGYKRFLAFCLSANLIWVGLYTITGYFFGNMPFVKRNFEYFIIGILLSTFIPPIWIFVKSRIKRFKQKQLSDVTR